MSVYVPRVVVVEGHPHRATTGIGVGFRRTRNVQYFLIFFNNLDPKKLSVKVKDFFPNLFYTWYT